MSTQTSDGRDDRLNAHRYNASREYLVLVGFGRREGEEAACMGAWGSTGLFMGLAPHNRHMTACLYVL